MKNIFISLLFFVLLLSTSYAQSDLKVGMSFDWNLSGGNYQELGFSKDTQVVDIDAFETSKETVQKLQTEGKIVIAYISVGSWEPYRDDAGDFQESIIGKKYPGSDDEKILDIGNYEVFSDILETRFDMIQEKGFDGIEPDNMGIYGFDEDENISSFNLSKGDGIEFAKYIAREAHNRDLFILQKNALEISGDIEQYFDGVLLEDEFYYDETSYFTHYIDNNKPVFAVEYTDITPEKQFSENICAHSNEIKFTTILKQRELGKYIKTCKYILTDSDNLLIENIIRKIDILVEQKKISYIEISDILFGYKENKKDNRRLYAILEKTIQKLGQKKY